LGDLWALEWAWHIAETNLRWAGISGICMHNPSIVALIVSDISVFIRTDDMARLIRLVILMKNIYTLWGGKRILLPFTYFPTNLVYPFTLRVTDIKIDWSLKAPVVATCKVFRFSMTIFKNSIFGVGPGE